jgi:hypothetical protein
MLGCGCKIFSEEYHTLSTSEHTRWGAFRCPEITLSFSRHTTMQSLGRIELLVITLEMKTIGFCATAEDRDSESGRRLSEIANRPSPRSTFYDSPY